MTEEFMKNGTWESVILGFLEQKREAEEEKYLKEQIKIIAKAFEVRRFFDNEIIKNFFDPKKTKKDKNQSALDFQKEKLKKIFTFEQQPEEINLDKIKSDYQEKINQIKDKFEPQKWINDATQNASSVSFATHVIKLTHSKIDSPSIYDQVDVQRTDILSTSSLREKSIDGAVSGNQFAPIYQFLELDLNGKKLASLFADENNLILKPFAQTNDKDKYIKWNKGFSKSLITSHLGSHALAKQIYFPIDSNQKKYHLLCNVKSSSLAHAIYKVIIDNKQKDIRKIRENNKYSDYSTVSFPQKAILNVTASNHSNASQLNGNRAGRLYLFSCQPPIWQNQLKPPTYYESHFYAITLHKNTRATLDYLRDFLMRYQLIDLSIKAPERRKWIDNWLNDIVDEVLAYAAEIQNLEAGWTGVENIKLKTAHQYFLDPYRDDKTFQSARKASNWQAVVCQDFAHWLNQKLIGKEKNFTPQPFHTRIWIELLEQPIREHNTMIEAREKV
jgi:CRISPR-associated protein Csy1